MDRAQGIVRLRHYLEVLPANDLETAAADAELAAGAAARKMADLQLSREGSKDAREMEAQQAREGLLEAQTEVRQLRAELRRKADEARGVEAVPPRTL